MGARFRTFVVVAELDSPAGHVTSLLTWLLSRADLGNAGIRWDPVSDGSGPEWLAPGAQDRMLMRKPGSMSVQG
ncbi:hypothetical protein PoMZ_10704, partial [Pyricularia oryzae]